MVSRLEASSSFEAELKWVSIGSDFGLALSASICVSRMEVLGLKLKDGFGGVMVGV